MTNQVLKKKIVRAIPFPAHVSQQLIFRGMLPTITKEFEHLAVPTFIELTEGTFKKTIHTKLKTTPQNSLSFKCLMEKHNLHHIYNF